MDEWIEAITTIFLVIFVVFIAAPFFISGLVFEACLLGWGAGRQRLQVFLKTGD